MSVVARVAGSIAPPGQETGASVVEFHLEGVRPVYTFAPNAVLDAHHVGLMLGISADSAAELPLKWSPIGNGKHKFRYRVLAKYVIEYIENLARPLPRHAR